MYIYEYMYNYPPPCPQGTRCVFIMCLRGPCHGDPGWNVELFKGTPPPPGHAPA